MLSISGLTLEQFADLMGGLGFNAEKGEREKVKPVDMTTPKDGAPKVTEAPAEAPDTPVMDVAAEEPAGPSEIDLLIEIRDSLAK